MDCTNVKKLLSEYIDDLLDVKTKTELERHIATCKVCSEELALLKVYTDKMSTLETVKAPEDFLQKVHRRLETRFAFERIIRGLFFPARVKIPLELAAVAATIILGIFVLNITQQQKQVTVEEFPAPEQITVAKAPQEEIAKLEQGPIKEKPIEIAKVEKEPYEVEKPAEPEPAVVEKPAGAMPAEPAQKEVTVAKIAAIEPQKPIVIALLVKPKPAAAKPAFLEGIEAITKMGEEVTAQAGRRQVGTMSMTEEFMQKQKPATQGVDLSKALIDVKNFIQVAEGKVISIEYVEGTTTPKHITAGIPPKNYETFLKNLSGIGSVQTPPEEVPSTATEQFLVKIEFTPSK